MRPNRRDILEFAEAIGVEGDLHLRTDEELLEAIRLVLAERRAAQVAAEGGSR